jgi:hypothetical protein
VGATSNEPVDSVSNNTLHHKEPVAYTHTPSSNTPNTPKTLVGSLNNLTLEAQVGDDIVLEDPPNDSNKDPLDAWNPLSLAEPEGDEALALQLSNTEEPEGNKDEPSKYTL